MNKDIKSRVIFLAASLLICFFVTLVVFIFVFEHNNQKLISDIRVVKKKEMQHVLNVVSVPYKNFANDYAFWDETAQFLLTHDLKWAKDNLQDVIKFNNIDQVLLIDTGLSYQYNTPQCNGSDCRYPFLKAEVLKLFNADDTISHFFYRDSNDKIVEIYMSPIKWHTLENAGNRPAGWLFAIRNLDDVYINSLSELIGGKVVIKDRITNGDTIFNKKSGKMNIVFPISNWENKNTGYISVEYISPFFDKIKTERKWFFMVFFVFGATLVLLLIWFVRNNMIKPFHAIVESLATRNINILEKSPGQTNEFKKIKSNIAGFFAQETLIKEIQMRRDAEASLYKSQLKYRMIVESVPDVVWILNREGVLNYITQNIVDLSGYTDKELLKRTPHIVDLVDENDRENFNRCLHEFISHGVPFDIDIRGCKKDGTLIWVSVKAIQKFVQNGKSFYCGRISDISEKKRNEVFLFEREWLFRSLYEQNPVGVAMLTLPDLQITSTNKAFCDMLGYSEEEFKNMSLKDFTHPDDFKKETEECFKLLFNGKSYTLEKRVLKKDGKYLWISVTATNIFNKEGIPLMACGIVENINERKLAQEALHREHNLLVILMNNIPDFVFFKDTKTQYMKANKAFREYLGCENVSEIIGKTVFDFFNESDAKALNDQDCKVLDNKTPIINYEFSHINKDGTKEWNLTSKVPVFNESGEIEGLIGITRNITESKNREKQLKIFSQELADINAAKDKFLTIIAHDLKNPFNSILGLTTMLYEDYGILSDDERRKFSATINDAAKVTYSLIQNMLEWSRAQTGRIENNPEYLDLSVLVTDTINLLKPIAEAKTIFLISTIPYNTVVFADQNMVLFVLRNLVSNAIKFSHKNNRIIISARLIDEKYSEICVSDYGTGISEENIKKLFRIDEQYKMNGTNGEKGTGLGLVVCKEFVELNGGRIWVESQFGKGSNFYFALPCEKLKEENIK